MYKLCDAKTTGKIISKKMLTLKESSIRKFVYSFYSPVLFIVFMMFKFSQRIQVALCDIILTIPKLEFYLRLQITL